MSDQVIAPTAIAEGLSSYLLAKYGVLMTAGNLAEQLQTSVTALRIARHRGHDLPPPASLPGRGWRWLSTDVATWLASRSGTPLESVEERRPDVRPPNTKRRPGRHRIQAATGAAAPEVARV